MTLHKIFLLIFISTILATPKIVQAVSCGDGVFGNITLTEDLFCDTGYTALEVFADGVTIDLNGHTVSGTGDLAGISIFGYKGVTIRNGAIKGFWAGVNSMRSHYLTVDNVTFYEGGFGVIISSASNGYVAHNDFIRTSSAGVSIKNTRATLTSQQNVIDNNEFYQAQTGIELCGDKTNKNTISNNLVWKSVDYAIHLNHSDNNKLINNRILETSGNSSVRLNNSSYNLMSGNSIQGGDQYALTVLANAGGPCLASDQTRSLKNRFISNSVVNMGQLILLGLGSVSSAEVVGTGITDNRFISNSGRIRLEHDAHSSYLRNNVFIDTDSAIDDNGTNNHY
ncbi:right-handed parallel beta-helix repeat-containing protein [Arenicella xantha]|uniref:Parallel beta-helix repeat protein n=1 Tax=Arenicella xantha TaxID=644221 RepID=A0A395JQ95_9GAMM|nr:right-handed parallel beta-helix repeat-containing protein [Arenicella xantha]RBP53779.1 parallel beta-helix repeat protein [Arenicella xantha]